jgi:hypothetical protein
MIFLTAKSAKHAKGNIRIETQTEKRKQHASRCKNISQWMKSSLFVNFSFLCALCALRGSFSLTAKDAKHAKRVIRIKMKTNK